MASAPSGALAPWIRAWAEHRVGDSMAAVVARAGARGARRRPGARAARCDASHRSQGPGCRGLRDAADRAERHAPGERGRAASTGAADPRAHRGHPRRGGRARVVVRHRPRRPDAGGPARRPPARAAAVARPSRARARARASVPRSLATARRAGAGARAGPGDPAIARRRLCRRPAGVPRAERRRAPGGARPSPASACRGQGRA